MTPGYQSLGDFELIRELGRGGMGIVYEARQVSLNRKVALKVLKVGLGLTTQAVNRFRREAAAAAKLHHTNIVPIYATGEDGDYHFYAMELIEGSSLDRVIKAERQQRNSDHVAAEVTRLTSSAGERARRKEEVSLVTSAATTVSGGSHSPTTQSGSSPVGEASTTLQSGSGYFDQVARMFAEVADGLEHAHRHGVIHRDIKPSNLLVSPQGRLHLTDFGLARVLEEPGMTVTGEFMGSPLYMSPEQIAAGRAQLDHRTDIYSLGATLYEAVTLHPPFQGERRDQVISQILHKEPKPPRALERKIPPDLETICLKAMDKDPDRRYRTAGAFAEDLRRYVNRFAIEARRASLPQRAVKWAHRHPAIAIAAGMAVVALLLVGMFARKAQVVAERLLEEQRRAAVQEAVLAARNGDPAGAERAIEKAETLRASPGELRLLRGQVAQDQLKPAEAVRHLKQAVVLLPKSVSARSLLARAQWDANLSSAAEATMRGLELLSPITAEDFLFKGQAQVEVSWDPEEGLKTLDEGIKRGDSLMARMIRAEGRGRYASLTGDTTEIRGAREDINVAHVMKPGNPAVLRESLELHALAAAVYRWKGMAQARQAELEQGAEDLHALESVHTAAVAVTKGFFALERGNEDEAVREWEPFARGEGCEWVLEHYVPVLYARGEFAKAVALLEPVPETSNETLRCFTLPELPDGANRAYATVKRQQAKGIVGFDSVVALLPLQLLGRAEEAVGAYAELRNRFQYPARDHWYEHILEYEVGKLSAEQLIAIAGNSQWNLCEGHFYIALKELSQGDRQGAREHFRLSLATPVIRFYEYRWSRAFLRRMEADPNWPAWIKANAAADLNKGQ
jgi:serine/threonine protein kinase